MAGITVQMNPTRDKANSSAQASGSIIYTITDSDRSSFGLSDSQLKDAVGKNFGKNPNDAYLRSPTPWNDLYKTYGWPETTVTLIPVSATVVSVNAQPLIVATQKFTNNSSKTGTFNVSITEKVDNTSESNWQVTKTLGVTQTINYGISFLGSGGGGSTSMSYTQAWAQGGSQSQTISLGSTQAVSVTLGPNESLTAQLPATKGTMTVQITYQAYLSGDTAINYSSKYKDHHFWGLWLPNVMQSANIPNLIQFVETVKIGYYVDSDIKLLNASFANPEISAAKAGEAETLVGEPVQP